MAGTFTVRLSATLTLNNVQTTNAGSYSVVVTNSAGTVVSSNALLFVSGADATPPSVAILIQPPIRGSQQF